MQNINKKNKFTFIRKFFSISFLMILNFLGFTQLSSAQTFVFDGTHIGSDLTEGIIDTNNTATNQTSFGKTQVYFGGDTPDIQSDNGGVVASSILTNDSYDLTAIGALKISGTFYNRDANASYNESYVGIVSNGTTRLANPSNGYPVDDREGMNIVGGGTSQKTIPTAKWFNMSATIAIQGTDLVLLEKNIDGNISGPTVIGPVSDYPYLNDLRAFIAIDDHASQMDVEILSSNLVTTVSTSSSTASVGDTVSYTITVTNRGSKDETNISLTDYIPGSLEHPLGNVSQGTFSDDGIWLIGDLAKDESVTLTLSGTVSDGVQGGVISNTTTAASRPDLADPTTQGDILTADISIDPIAPLQGACSGAFDWDNSGWEFGQKVGTITLMDGLTADINVSTTSAGTFSMNTLETQLDTPFVDSKTYYFGGVSDLGIIFEPDANTGTSPVTIKLTFSEPVHNGSFLITDIDTSTNGTSDRDDQVTVTSDLGTPTLQVVHSSAPLVSVNANVATTTYNDVNGSQNDTRGTVRVVIPDGATSVTLTYEEMDTTVEDHGARGIGAFGNLAVCKAEVDTDGDGIADKDDLDDDNDGILDVNETNPLQFVNFNFSDTLNNWITSSSEDVGFVHYENNGDGRTAVDQNFRTASLSQSISSETCANPGVKSFSFDLKWNNGADNTKPDEETESILDVSFGGVQYLSVRTPRDGTSNVDDASDQGGDALLTPMNGATVVLSSPSDQGALYLDHAKWEDIVYSKVTITLPSEISNAEILFYMNVKVDDYHLDNIQLEDAYCGIDTDGDGILNHLDLDVDNDGIPDNIEAQTTADYTPTSGTVDAEGTYSAIYGANGLTPVDTDEDNVTDMLDTDSDNDGSLDKDESGLTLSGNVGTNGLDNNVDTADDYVDVNGKVNTPSSDLKEADNNSADVDYRSLAAQNNPPVAIDSNHTIATGSTQVLDLESLITDSDTGDTLSIVSINDVNLTGGVQTIVVPNGEIHIDANNVITFVPNAGFTGSTSFDYVGTDGTDTVVASVNITVTKDTDSDGVIDSIDLDDDNDGVLDVNERCDFPYQETIVDGSWVGVSDSTYSVTKTTGFVADDTNYHRVASLNKGEIIVEHNGFYNAAGTMDITYNFSPAIPANDLFFGFSDVDSATANYSGDFTITFNGGATMSDFDIVTLEDYPLLKANNNILSTSGIDDEAAYFIGRTSKLVSSVTIKSSTIPSGDNIAFFIGGTSAPCDKDGDGIPNYLDLDADNDGIPDNVEAQTTAGYKAPTGSVDANGTWSAVYGANGLIPVDTDEDNVTDMLDTDSDNDGTEDKVESGLTLTNADANNDGIDDGVHASYADVNGDVNTPSSDLKEADNNSADVDYRSLAAQNNVSVTVDDTKTGTTGNPVEVDVLANDTDAEDDIDPTTVKIIDENGNPVTTLTVPNEGTWTVNATTGAITFTPLASFTSDPTPITYVVSDKAENTSAPATVNVDYPQTGTNSSEDNVTAETGKAVTIDVLSNDTDAEDDIDPTTVKIIDENGNPVTTLTVPNEGTWIVNATTGAITFTPLTSFTGDPTPITYVVSDTTGNVSEPATVNVDYPEVELDSDNDGIPDSIDLDDDNDGIPDTVEEHGTLDLDTDGDGVPNRLDLDSDNDGILDLLESGQDPSVVDTDGNGVLDSDVDADKDGLMDTADSDDDDKTSSGKVTPIDTDGDHKPDFQDIDSDNDSLSDMVEAGIPAENDKDDSDGMIDEPAVDVHGVPTVVDSVKNPVNTDGDTVPDYRDLDSDNDGLNDVTEVDGLDENKDGIVDTEGSLVNGTSIPDSDENDTPDVLDVNNPNLPVAIDGNGDGIIDDNKDSDHDGIPDVTDGNDSLFGTGTLLDSDGDGIADEFDIDDDNDGNPDVVENRGNPSRDTDDDGIIDSLDLDSDNDGILDIVEAGGVDAHNDGRVDDAKDSDKDGLADIVDAAPAVANNPTDENAGRLVSLLLIPDTDGDKKPDFQDVDSDNDGLSDLVEAGVSVSNDENNNGMIDGDVNSDGIPKVTTPIAHPLDSDNDNLPDYRELDSDNDGKKDIVEAGGTDTDHDGLVDDIGTLIDVSNLPDIDGNRIPDYRELNGGVKPRPTATPSPTSTPVPIATPEIKPDKKVVDLAAPVTVNVLANDEGDLNSSSVQIELPNGFMEQHPNAVFSEDGKSLTVPGEGTWTVNADGTITYRAEAETTPVNPTPISYSVANTDGKRLKTDATIVLSQSVVAGGTNTVESCDCVSVEDNVSIYESWNLVLVLVLGSIFGLFFFRREKN